MVQKRCQAEGGPANCRAKNCPERDELGIILRTEHGSHLYGLAHANSDVDTYVVVKTKKTAKRRNMSQRIDGDADVTKVDWNTFLELCNQGVPQALEAMYAPEADIDELASFRQNYFANSPEVVDTYLRTIVNFALNMRIMANTVKTRRHAARLVLNLNELITHGQFNPRLSSEEAKNITRIANLPWKEYRAAMDELSIIEIPWKKEGTEEDNADQIAAENEAKANEKVAAAQ